MKNKELLRRLEQMLDENPNDLGLRLDLIKEYSDDGEKLKKLLEYSFSEEDLSTERKELLSDAFLKLKDETLFEYEGINIHIDYNCAKLYLALDKREKAKELYEKIKKRNTDFIDYELEPLLDEEDRKARLKIVDSGNTVVVDLFKSNEDHITFDDVGGLHDVKKHINKRIILPYKKPSLFSRFKRKSGGGILMYGPPGVGKTMLARATAGECRANFMNIAITDILDMYIGESERKMHQIFETARAQSPTVLFFDEIEAIATKRQYTRDNNTSKLISQFLSELDGFAQNNDGVLILGSTNVPWALDSAFLRPGRFDRAIFIPPPDQEARKIILDLLLKDKPVNDDINMQAIIKSTNGFSGADLKNLVETAIDEAIEESIDKNKDVNLSHVHFANALHECRSTVVDWLTTARNYTRYSNESGLYNDLKKFLDKYTKK